MCVYAGEMYVMPIQDYSITSNYDCLCINARFRLVARV